MLSKLWTSYYVMCLKKDKNKNSFLRSWETVILSSFHIGTGITHWNISNHQVPQAWTLTFPGFFFLLFNTVLSLRSTTFGLHFSYYTFSHSPSSRRLSKHGWRSAGRPCPDMSQKHTSSGMSQKNTDEKKLAVRVLHLLTRVFKKKKRRIKSATRDLPMGLR